MSLRSQLTSRVVSIYCFFDMFDTFYTSTLNFIHSSRHHVIKKSISFGLHSTRQMSIDSRHCVDIVWTCLNILCPGWVSKRPLDYQARAVTNELPRSVVHYLCLCTCVCFGFTNVLSTAAIPKLGGREGKGS
uniref:Uncharacterized protein n=1 Tax=Cacopsylla melanoneura TaxID=428564 RepID=A0A8D8RKI9_9HEMI